MIKSEYIKQKDIEVWQMGKYAVKYHTHTHTHIHTLMALCLVETEERSSVSKLLRKITFENLS